MELARWKADSDVALADKKIALERSLANWTRKTELAEQALALVSRRSDYDSLSEGVG